LNRFLRSTDSYLDFNYLTQSVTNNPKLPQRRERQRKKEKERERKEKKKNYIKMKESKVYFSIRDDSGS